MRYFAYRTGSGEGKHEELVFKTDDELMFEALNEHYQEELFETVEAYLDFITKAVDGGYCGEWIELEINNHKINKKI